MICYCKKSLSATANYNKTVVFLYKFVERICIYSIALFIYLHILLFWCRHNLQVFKAWKCFASKQRARVFDRLRFVLLDFLQATGMFNLYCFPPLLTSFFEGVIDWRMIKKYMYFFSVLCAAFDSGNKWKEKASKVLVGPDLYGWPMRASNSFVGIEEYVAPVGSLFFVSWMWLFDLFNI